MPIPMTTMDKLEGGRNVKLDERNLCAVMNREKNEFYNGIWST